MSGPIVVAVREAEARRYDPAEVGRVALLALCGASIGWKRYGPTWRPSESLVRSVQRAEHAVLRDELVRCPWFGEPT